MPNPPLEPRRVAFDDRRRLTIPKRFRDGVGWLQAIKAGDVARYQLVTPGRARLLAVDPIAAAIADDNEMAANNLAAAVATGAWESESRVTLPPTVSDWLFGKGNNPDEVWVWANVVAIEFWNEEEWPRSVARIGASQSSYLPPA